MRRYNPFLILIVLVVVGALAFPVLSSTAGPLQQETATAEPEATATVEETSIPEATATVEETSTPEETATVEVTETETATAEVTETITATAEAPETATVEATETATATIEVSETVTATVEATETETATATAEAAETAQATATPAIRVTPLPTRIDSVVATLAFTPTGEMATASLLNSAGEEIGTAELSAVKAGEDAVPAVLVRIHIEDFSVGEIGSYGVHLHETGACEAPDFESAGGHFNPTDRSHGFLNPDVPHAGDLPMIRVEADGSAQYAWITALVSLNEGKTNLLDDDGSALVVHASLDNYLTDPGGASGERLLCGEIIPTDEAPAGDGGTPVAEETPAVEATETPQATATPEAEATSTPVEEETGTPAAEETATPTLEETPTPESEE